MNANDLRIGNIVDLYDNGWHKNHVITGKDIKNLDEDFEGCFFEGIKLTHNVLIRAGLKKWSDNYVYTEHDSCYLYYSGGEVVIDTLGGGIAIAKQVDTLHLLQNIIHALTGKELILKDHV